MITSEIIQKFELYVDDTTELASTEELDLANKIYQFVCDFAVWEFLKKEATGTISGTEITLPSNFAHLLENYNYTDNSISTQANAKPVYVFIDDSPVQVVNWSDRRRYSGSSYCYLDMVNEKIVFPSAQSGTYSFDYKFVPEDLTLATSPVFPARYHDIISHGMAVDDMIIQLFPRAKSYAQENQNRFNAYLSSMSLWNANLQNY
mgnify:CR=1 FL=1